VPALPRGGETSEFGLQAACVSALRYQEVDRAQAEDIGFGVDEYTRVVEMPLDLPMRWLAEDSEAGGPALGYEQDTRLRLTLEIEGFEYAELDPARCDDTSCTLEDGTTTEVDGCEPFVFVRARGEFETADGAVEATLESQPISLLRAGEVEPVAAARVDLTQVRGTLRIDPAIPEPYVGVIHLSLQYLPAGELQYAVLSVDVYPDWDALGEDAHEIPSELSSYRPLQGRAGSLLGP
jgi:hypothetical protein